MSTRKTTLFSAAVIAVAFTAIGMVMASRFNLAPAPSAQTFPPPVVNSTPITGTIDATTFRRIAEEQTPMVVNIRTESQRSSGRNDLFGQDDFSAASSETRPADRRRPPRVKKPCRRPAPVS